MQQHKNIDDPDLVQHIKECEDIPGWELFQFYDEDGGHQSIDSGMVNDYLHEISSEIFSAKDFRTWGATREFFKHMVELPPAESEKQIEKNLLSGFDAAADALGNTRSVCRQYYVHPQVPEIYKTGEFEPYHEKMNTYKDSNHFAASEKCIQEIIDNFEIEFKKVK